LVFFAAGLMAKPMLVTLPFVLLLLDFWPLRRWTMADRSQLAFLLQEKIPLLFLTIISSLVTIVVQQQWGAIVALEKIPVGTRVANGFMSYFMYAFRMLWPANLTVLYPSSVVAPRWWWAAAIVVIAVSISSLWALERWPYIAVGWFWYVGTLVPVLGIVQVGLQASADRYTYVPLIGLFLIMVFGIDDALKSLPSPKLVFASVCAVTILTCVWLTRVQLRYWQSSETLWEHNLAINNEDPLALDYFASNLLNQGRSGEALPLLLRAVQGDPSLASAQNDLGVALERAGSVDDAIAHYSEAIRLDPALEVAYANLDRVLATHGKKAISIVPRDGH
jgi:tetratricopeptide (TPR) repeat protein